MPDDIRFTPQEIKELAASGALTPQDLQKMHPSDRAVAAMELNKGQNGTPYKDFDINKEGLFGGRPARTPLTTLPQAATAGAGIAAGANPAALGSHVAATAPYLKAGLGIGAANWALDKMGVPAPIKMGLEMMLGMRALPKGAKVPSTVAAEEAAVAAESAEIIALRKSLEKQGYPPELIEKILAKDAARGAAVAPAEAAGGARAPLLQAEKPYEEAAELVKKGVTNDFRGRVTFENPTKGVGPRNATFDDIKEQVTGSSRLNWEDPRGTAPGYGPESDAEVEQIRKLIQEILGSGGTTPPSGVQRRRR